MADLFDYKPAQHARREDPLTSHRAAQEASGLAQAHVRLICDALASGTGTAEEIGDRCGLDNVAVCRRLASMERQDMVARTTDKRRQRNGRLAQVWER